MKFEQGIQWGDKRMLEFSMRFYMSTVWSDHSSRLLQIKYPSLKGDIKKLEMEYSF